MSPAQFNDQHAKKETVSSLSSPSSSSFLPLQINKDSHFIKKSSPSSCSSSSSSLSLVSCVANVTIKSQQQQQQQRHPVIIYTHSPKIIHTHPKDFMALVQKLTGLSRSDHQQQQDDHHQNQNHQLPPPSKLLIDPNNHDHDHHNRKKINKGAGNCMMMNDDNESTSVVTDDNNGSNNTTTTNLGEAQVNSCFVPPPIFDPPNPCFNSIPFFNPNSTDFLCTAQPFYNYSDSLLFMPNIRSSLSSSTLEGMKELPDF